MEDRIHIFGKEIIDEAAIKQLENCMTEDSLGTLTADAHKGYSCPIGGAVAYKNQISPSGVGFDIACGNYAVKTNIKSENVAIKRIMDEIHKQIGFGVGRPNPKPIDHPVLEKIAHSEFEPQRSFVEMASIQLGTVGSGNHYVDVFEDEEGWVWVGVHFGSRGFGHKTARGFIALHQGLDFLEGKANEGSMDSKPILFGTDTYLGQAYISAMHLAGEYAYAGREVVVNKVLEILGAQSTFSVHNHHNFAWLETHFGEQYWVVRKGCTPANPGQMGFIGANMADTMADTSVIVEGVDSELSRKGLYSTVHGAGRIMSRTEAAGKKKWMKGEDGRKRPVRITKGKIDFDEVKKFMKERNIELRGGGADEAPKAYKKLIEVLKYQGETIRVLHKLRPLGVAMAGESEYDPYKD